MENKSLFKYRLKMQLKTVTLARKYLKTKPHSNKNIFHILPKAEEFNPNAYAPVKSGKIY